MPNNLIKKMSSGIYNRTEEHNKKISIANKGKSRNKGRKLSEEHKRKIKENHRHYQSMETRRKIIETKIKNGSIKKISDKKKILFKRDKGFKIPEEIKKKISESLKGRNIGEKGSNWKGGISKLDKIIRDRYEYHNWVSYCITRDNWTCQTCRKIGGKLQVHHKKSFALILKENNIKTIEEALNCKELWNINNGITLCLDCHKQTDTYLKRIEKKGG